MSLLDSIDFDAVEAEIADMVTDALEETVDAAAADLKTFGKDIARDIVTVIRAGGDDRLMRSLKGQARMLAEINRIRLNRNSRALLNRILDVAARVGKVLLSAAVAAV